MYKENSSNKALLEILEEEESLRQDFYSILNELMKNLLSFNYPKISRIMKEYLNFKKLLEYINNFSKNRKKKRYQEQVIHTPLKLEDREVAVLIRIFPSKLSKVEKRLDKEIATLKSQDKDFLSIIYLEHIRYLLKNNEFRDLIFNRKHPVLLDPELKNFK